VQQQEAANSAKTKATSVQRIRVMGVESEGIKENEEEVFSEEGRRRGKSLGRSHISRLAGSRGAWAAGGGEKRSSSGDEGEFHDFNEVVFDWAMT